MTDRSAGINASVILYAVAFLLSLMAIGFLIYDYKYGDRSSEDEQIAVDKAGNDEFSPVDVAATSTRSERSVESSNSAEQTSQSPRSATEESESKKSYWSRWSRPSKKSRATTISRGSSRTPALKFISEVQLDSFSFSHSSSSSSASPLSPAGPSFQDDEDETGRTGDEENQVKELVVEQGDEEKTDDGDDCRDKETREDNKTDDSRSLRSALFSAIVERGNKDPRHDVRKCTDFACEICKNEKKPKFVSANQSGKKGTGWDEGSLLSKFSRMRRAAKARLSMQKNKTMLDSNPPPIEEEEEDDLESGFDSTIASNVDGRVSQRTVASAGGSTNRSFFAEFPSSRGTEGEGSLGTRTTKKSFFAGKSPTAIESIQSEASSDEDTIDHNMAPSPLVSLSHAGGSIFSPTEASRSTRASGLTQSIFSPTEASRSTWMSGLTHSIFSPTTAASHSAFSATDAAGDTSYSNETKESSVSELEDDLGSAVSELGHSLVSGRSSTTKARSRRSGGSIEEDLALARARR